MDIKKLNKEAKEYEKHHEVNLLIDGIEILATFDTFTKCSFDSVSFTIKANDDEAKKYSFDYDYKEGMLTCLNYEGIVEVTGLLCKRHLRSLLFYAHDYAFREDGSKTVMTEYIHQSMPVPQMWTECKSMFMKRYLKIDNVLVCNDKEIIVDGILAMQDRDNFWFPFYAKCKYTYKTKLYKWTYFANGKEVNVETEEYDWTSSPIDISYILYEYTRQKAIAIRTSNEPKEGISKIEKDVLDILEEKEFFMCSERGADRISDFINFIIYGIKSITSKDIIFKITDGESPCDTLTYDRNRKKIFHSDMTWTGRKAKTSYTFLGTSRENQQILQRAIQYIEEADML